MSYYNDSELTLTSYNACIYSAMKIFIIADFFCYVNVVISFSILSVTGPS